MVLTVVRGLSSMVVVVALVFVLVTSAVLVSVPGVVLTTVNGVSLMIVIVVRVMVISVIRAPPTLVPRDSSLVSVVTLVFGFPVLPVRIVPLISGVPVMWIVLILFSNVPVVVDTVSIVLALMLPVGMTEVSVDPRTVKGAVEKIGSLAKDEARDWALVVLVVLVTMLVICTVLDDIAVGSVGDDTHSDVETKTGEPD